MFIPKDFHLKASRLCQVIHEVEWSGFLFFQIQGDMFTAPEQVVITAKDIYLQDLGTAAHTQFNNIGEEIVDMYDKHPEWMKCRMGLIHSHNRMAVFFSGEDVSELEDNCPGTDFYFSLIVNNKGEYAAAAAFMAEVNVVNNGVRRYQDSSHKWIEQPFTTNTSQKQMIMLEFTVEVEQDEELVSRIAEIRSRGRVNGREVEKFQDLGREAMEYNYSRLKEQVRDDDFDDNWREHRKVDKTVSPRQIDLFEGTTEGEKFLEIVVAKVLAMDDAYKGDIYGAIAELGTEKNPDYTAEMIIHNIDTIYSRITGKQLKQGFEERIVKKIMSFPAANSCMRFLKSKLQNYYGEVASV